MNRRDFSDEGDAWDGATWVDVGDDGRWHPSAAERTRAFVLLGGLIGVLVLVAAVSSFGGGDASEIAAVTTTTTTMTTQPEQTTTTQPLPSSVGGEAPPDDCLGDDRDAAPLREPSELSVTVLNGARVGGLAGDTSGELQNLGYDARPDDAEATVETSITYVTGYCAEAVALAEALRVPVTTISEGPSDGDAQLVVVLGSDNFTD